MCLGEGVGRHSSAEGNSLWPVGDYEDLCFHNVISLRQETNISLSQWSCGHESARLKPLTPLAAGGSLWLWAVIQYLPGILLCVLYDGFQILLKVIELSPLPRGMIEARPQQTLRVFWEQEQKKVIQVRKKLVHWIPIATSIQTQKLPEYNSAALWIVKLCLFLSIQAGRKGFLWFWCWASLPFPSSQLLENFLEKCLLRAVLPTSSPACPQAGSSCPFSKCYCSTPCPSRALGACFTHPSLSHRAIFRYTSLRLLAP